MDIELPAVLEDQLPLLAAKRTMLREASNLKTLVVGSSHGDFGFDPSFVPGSFNLCCRSQDLKHSYHLYRKVTEERGGLATLVVFFSLFSPGWVLERNPIEGEISVGINELFGLDLSYEDGRLASIHDSLKGKVDELDVQLPGCAGFLPNNGKHFIPTTVSAEQRAADHLKLNRLQDALPYLRLINDLAARNNNQLIFVIPPMRPDFLACVGSSDHFFEALYENAKRGEASSILNLFSNGHFPEVYFGDPDHLIPSSEGSKLMSRMIAEAVG